MCGILACFGPHVSREEVVRRSVSLQHRGPDDFQCRVFRGGVMAFRRLRVMPTCRQPIQHKHLVCMTNGEIYNHRELIHEFQLHPTTKNDCEVVPLLYERLGPRFVTHLRGMFAIVLIDLDKNIVFAARDHMGIIPLYVGTHGQQHWFASECKAHPCLDVFPPRHFSVNGTRTQWYNPQWVPRPLGERSGETEQIYSVLLAAVRERVQCHAPFACLLSGGLDSSLITALVRHILPPCMPVHTFCIGLPGAPDFEPARRAAAFLGTVHHEVTFTVEEGIDAIPQVIRHLETYDVTTVRASTPQFLLARRIASMGFKMALSGEGADEAWGGYLYFKSSPTEEAFHKETVDKLMTLHYYDCLRTNKSMAAHGLEVRVPFLDPLVLEASMTLPTHLKRTSVEKKFLRELSDRYQLLPHDVAWRQKDQFSDSVGSNWIQGLKAHAETLGHQHPECATHESAWYKHLFLQCGYNPSMVPIEDNSIACSTATGAQWVAAHLPRDPSANALKST